MLLRWLALEYRLLNTELTDPPEPTFSAAALHGGRKRFKLEWLKAPLSAIFLAHALASESSEPLLVSAERPLSDRAPFMSPANWFSKAELKPPAGTVDVVVAGTVVVVVGSASVAGFV